MTETPKIYTKQETRKLFKEDPIMYAEMAHQYPDCQLPIKTCATHYYACDCREEKFKQLYITVNFLMAKLGAEGEISSVEEGVSEVMQALDELDDGVWDVEKVFMEAK